MMQEDTLVMQEGDTLVMQEEDTLVMQEEGTLVMQEGDTVVMQEDNYALLPVDVLALLQDTIVLPVNVVAISSPSSTTADTCATKRKTVPTSVCTSLNPRDVYINTLDRSNSTQTFKLSTEQNQHK